MSKTSTSLLAVLVMVALLVGCSSAPAPSPTAAPAKPAAGATAAPAAAGAPTAAAKSAASGPIKIGILAVLSGNTAAGGQDMVNGWNLWWDQHGSKTVAGRPVEFYVEDDAGIPDTGLTKARLLVEQRQVNYLVGGLVASVGLAVADYVKGTGTPYFIPVVSADDLTQRTRVPNVIRVAGWASAQPNLPYGEWAAKTKNYKNVVTIGEDYAFGYENVGGFVQTFTDNGGKLAQAIWHPLNTADLSPFLSQIDNYKPDVVYAEETGADAVRFVKAWHDLGLDKKYPLLGNETIFDQSNLRGMGDEAIGGISMGHYAEGRDSATVKKFVDDFSAKYNLIPGYYAAAMYSAADWLYQAMDKVNGNVEDKSAFLAAVRSVQLTDSAFGPMKLDQYDNPIENIYLRTVQKRPDGKLWNVVTDTIPNVSQFYKYPPDQYLKEPVYSRTYLGVKQ